MDLLSYIIYSFRCHTIIIAKSKEDTKLAISSGEAYQLKDLKTLSYVAAVLKCIIARCLSNTNSKVSRAILKTILNNSVDMNGEAIL